MKKARKVRALGSQKSTVVGETLDAETQARRAALEKLQKLPRQQLFDLAVRAGIYTKDGALAPPYRGGKARSSKS